MHDATIEIHVEPFQIEDGSDPFYEPKNLRQAAAQVGSELRLVLIVFQGR